MDSLEQIAWMIYNEIKTLNPGKDYTEKTSMFDFLEMSKEMTQFCMTLFQNTLSLMSSKALIVDK